MTYPLSLHIFRRDLRMQDNSALIAAAKQSEKILPCFIFDNRQIEQNDYKSDHAIQFMAQSLQSLQSQLEKKNGKLFFFYGIAEKIVEALLKELPIRAVFINRDYTPFSILRDRAIANTCKKYGVDFHYHADALLHEPEQVLKANGEPYTVFTHAFKRAQQVDVAAPQKLPLLDFYNETVSMEDTVTLHKLLKKSNPNIIVKGGREEGLKLIQKMKELQNYESTRNIPSLRGTTLLSAHHKFGTVSIREVYQTIVETFGPHHTLINELYWRDFFTHIAFHFPHVFKSAFHREYDAIKWSRSEKHLRAWQDGMTGFPIVDAGMRELKKTGYMHNRVRMITASFLTKDLHIDWRLGEQYFAHQLVDYDPAVNNGNWQWAASTGCDAQPYFRIFNPWLQQEKFDPECLYIKQWIPELASIPAKIIHRLFEGRERLLTNYPTPIIDHAKESAESKLIYQAVKK